MRRVKGLDSRHNLMAKHGDHPELPSLIEDLLEEDVHTVFLKADCPPRVKRGSIGELKLVEVTEHDGQWDTIRMEILQSELVDLAEQNNCLLYTSQRQRDATLYRMQNSA